MLGTDNGLIALEGGEKARIVPIKQKTNITEEMDPHNTNNLLDLLDGVRIRSIIKDSEDILWISTYSNFGLLKYEAS